MTVKTAIKCTPNFKKWWKRSQKKQKELVVNAVMKLANEVKKSSSGRPTIGRAKMLRGHQSPIYEIRVEKDLRLLYHVKIGIGEKNLLIMDVLDHDHLNHGAKQSVEHLVHAKKLDQIYWNDDDEITGIFELEPYKNEKGHIIGKFEYDSLDEKIKNNYKKMPKKELVTDFDDWVNERTKFYTEDDYWSEEIYIKAVEDACIWEFLDDKEKNEIFDDGEWEGKLVEEGEWVSKISLKTEQKELLKINEQVFILEGVAGTGKTTILEERFLIFIRNNEWRGKVLFLTHNKELSKSVKSRLKLRVNKKDHEYIDRAVIDVESWYRSIELRHLEKEYFDKINDKIGKRKAELRKLKDQLKKSTSDKKRLEKSIEKTKTSIEQRRNSLKYAKSLDKELKDENKRAKKNYEEFREKLERKYGKLNKRPAAAIATLTDLKTKKQEVGREYVSNGKIIKDSGRFIKTSQDKLRKAKSKLSEVENTLKQISVTNPQKIKKIEKEIINLEDNFNKPFPSKEYRQWTLFDPNKKITYDIFAKINQGKGKESSDQGVLWEEYRGVILGHGKNFLKERKELEKDEYLEISRDRGLSNKNQKTRPKVWEEINSFKMKREKYGGKYSKEKGGWIDQEQAKYTQKLLESEDIKYQAIFIDEVQDLTELQIAIMLNLLEGIKKFEVAGDTSQSVYPSAFRWDDTRKQVYEILEPKKFPEHYRMDINYRSTPYLVEAANLILDEHKDVMGEKRTTIRQRTDRLEKGTHPSIVRLSEKELIENLRELNLPNVFCPLLVRDNTIVRRLGEELATDEQKSDNESNPNVMTIPGCKGLEYENVIIWDPCSGSNRLLDDFYHYKKGNSITDSDAISLELRHLFVGITRSRYRLSLIGPDDQGINEEIISGLGYFESRDEFSMEKEDILNEFTKMDASSDDFIERAKEFEQRGKYQLAADAYRSAGLSNERNRCRGMYLLSINEHLSASEYFENAAYETENPDEQRNLFAQANSCIDVALEEDNGVEILERKARYCSYLGDEHGAKKVNAYRLEELGRLNKNERETLFKNSAELFIEIGQLEDASRIYKEIEDYFNVAKISIDLGDTNEFFSSVENWLKTDEKYFPILHSMFSGQEAWKKTVSRALDVQIQALPKSVLDEEKQKIYANQKQRAELELKKARNWNEKVQAYKRMGDFTKASDVLIENDQHLLALNLLLKEYSEDNDYIITDLLKTLKQNYGLDYLFQYHIDGKVPKNSEVLFEKIFPKSDINEWMKYMKLYEEEDNLIKHPIIDSDFVKNIFHRDIFSAKIHPLDKTYVGLININILLLQSLVKGIMNDGFEKSRNNIILMSLYHLKSNIDLNNEDKIHYQYFTIYNFIDSIISLEKELLESDSFGDEELYLILTQTFASIDKNLENVEIKETFFKGTKWGISSMEWFDRIYMIAFFWGLFSTIKGHKILDWKKSFGFIHYLYISVCGMVFMEEGGDYDDWRKEFSYDIRKAINDGLEKPLSGKSNHIMNNMDSQLEIRGRGCVSTFQKRGVIDKGINILDVDKLVSTKISINYESTKKLLRETNTNKIHFHKGSWLERTFDDFIKDIEENNDNDVNSKHESYDYKEVIEEIQEEHLDYDEEHDQTAPVKVEETVVTENSDVELSLDDSEIVEIIEVVIPKDDESINEEIIEVNFPFDEALNVIDPYEIFNKIGNNFIQESENQISDFRQMMWSWKDEINRRWIQTDSSNEKIILISAHQYLIDKNKELDKIGKFPISYSEKKEHGRRAKSIQKELFNRKYQWANRAIMS